MGLCRALAVLRRGHAVSDRAREGTLATERASCRRMGASRAPRALAAWPRGSSARFPRGSRAAPLLVFALLAHTCIGGRATTPAAAARDHEMHTTPCANKTRNPTVCFGGPHGYLEVPTGEGWRYSSTFRAPELPPEFNIHSSTIFYYFNLLAQGQFVPQLTLGQGGLCGSSGPPNYTCSWDCHENNVKQWYLLQSVCLLFLCLSDCPSVTVSLPLCPSAPLSVCLLSLAEQVHAGAVLLRRRRERHETLAAARVLRCGRSAHPHQPGRADQH